MNREKSSIMRRVDPKVYDNFKVERSEGLCRSFPEYTRKIDRFYQFQKTTEKSIKNISKGMSFFK